MPDDPQPTPTEPTRGPAPRAVLVADGVFDALVGIGLIGGTIVSVTRPLGAESLRPMPLFVGIGVGCLAVSALLLAASVRPDAAVSCHLIWLPNMLTTMACVALLLALPHLAHPYVVALALTGTGCAVFATLEWTVGSGDARRHRATSGLRPSRE